jgi:hypothetical protein
MSERRSERDRAGERGMSERRRERDREGERGMSERRRERDRAGERGIRERRREREGQRGRYEYVTLYSKKSSCVAVCREGRLLSGTELHFILQIVQNVSGTLDFTVVLTVEFHQKKKMAF